MRKAFFGFTFLIAELFPVGGDLTRFLSDDMYNAITRGVLPSWWGPLFSLPMVYLPAAAATAWFFRATRLASRVPLQVPGTTMLLIGSVLTVICLVNGFFSSTVGGGMVGFWAMLLPARVLLAVGAVKLLLSAMPSMEDMSTA